VAAAGGGMLTAAYFGDDMGDLPAFDGLDRLAAAGVDTVRVGVRTEEAPAELLRRADVVVDGPEGALALFEALARD
jgi:trehalose 6-phosphate phosphatase